MGGGDATRVTQTNLATPLTCASALSMQAAQHAWKGGKHLPPASYRGHGARRARAAAGSPPVHAAKRGAAAPAQLHRGVGGTPPLPSMPPTPPPPTRAAVLAAAGPPTCPPPLVREERGQATANQRQVPPPPPTPHARRCHERRSTPRRPAHPPPPHERRRGRSQGGWRHRPNGSARAQGSAPPPPLLPPAPTPPSFHSPPLHPHRIPPHCQRHTPHPRPWGMHRLAQPRRLRRLSPLAGGARPRRASKIQHFGTPTPSWHTWGSTAATVSTSAATKQTAQGGGVCAARQKRARMKKKRDMWSRGETAPPHRPAIRMERKRPRPRVTGQSPNK